MCVWPSGESLRYYVALLRFEVGQPSSSRWTGALYRVSACFEHTVVEKSFNISSTLWISIPQARKLKQLERKYYCKNRNSEGVNLLAVSGHNLKCQVTSVSICRIFFMLNHTSLALIIAAMEFGRSCPLECRRPQACCVAKLTSLFCKKQNHSITKSTCNL